MSGRGARVHRAGGRAVVGPTRRPPGSPRGRHLDRRPRRRRAGHGPSRPPGLRPEVALLIVGLVAFVTGALHLVLAPRALPRAEAPGPDSAADVAVGPEPGVDLEHYVLEAAQRLREASGRQPDSRAIAIVSFDDYLTPAQAGAVLSGGLSVLGARYRLAAGDPLAGARLEALFLDRVDVDGRAGLSGAVVPALAARAAQARREATAFGGLIASADEPLSAAAFEHDRKLLLEAADLVGPGGCACVYAVEVVGSLSDLAALARDRRVRLVDIGPPGVTGGQASLRSLLPEERGRAVGARPSRD